jgi:hypothetical protein
MHFLHANGTEAKQQIIHSNFIQVQHNKVILLSKATPIKRQN